MKMLDKILGENGILEILGKIQGEDLRGRSKGKIFGEDLVEDLAEDHGEILGRILGYPSIQLLLKPKYLGSGTHGLGLKEAYN